MSSKSLDTVGVILCGKTEQIGRGVIEGLKPGYEGKSPFDLHSSSLY